MHIKTLTHVSQKYVVQSLGATVVKLYTLHALFRALITTVIGDHTYSEWGNVTYMHHDTFSIRNVCRRYQ